MKKSFYKGGYYIYKQEYGQYPTSYGGEIKERCDVTTN